MIIIIIVVALIGIFISISSNTLPNLEDNDGVYETYVYLVNSCIEKSGIDECKNQKESLFSAAKSKTGITSQKLSDYPDVFTFYEEDLELQKAYKSIKENMEFAQKEVLITENPESLKTIDDQEIKKFINLFGLGESKTEVWKRFQEKYSECQRNYAESSLGAAEKYNEMADCVGESLIFHQILSDIVFLPMSLIILNATRS